MAISLRRYQRFLCDQAKGKNTIVLLPTGAGKTLVGAEIIREKLADDRTRIALFLVPKRFLVKQQAAALRNWLGSGLNVAEYCGGCSLPTEFNVLVSTPEAFRQQSSANKIGWLAISLVVFDEVHNVLKDHPYRKLALSLKRYSATGAQMPVQVVGLTALLTFDVTPDKMKKTIDKLSTELRITAMPHVSREDLQRDGFHAGASVQTEVRDDIDIPAMFEAEKVVPESIRKAHLAHKTFWARIQDKTATSFALSVVSIVKDLERCFPDFGSPLGKVKLASWGECAHKRAMQRAGTERKQFLYLEHWYETLRIVVQSWEEPKGLELAMLFLSMMTTQTGSGIELFPGAAQLALKIDNFVSAFQPLSPHLDHLVCELLRAKAERPAELRAVVFVQQQTAAHIIAYHLNQRESIRQNGLEAVPLHSTTKSSPTPSIKFKPADEKRNLRMFESGEITVLVATTVAEEGMDVGAANCVIRFDPVHHAVSFVQGRGRARQEQSSHIITSERADRSLAVLQGIEDLQGQIASTFSPPDVSAIEQEQHEAQNQRERQAVKGLTDDVNPTKALSVLNTFAMRTKANLEVHVNNRMLSLVYTSCLREVTATEQGAAPFKKAAQKNAKRNAALVLIRKLRAECGHPRASDEKSGRRGPGALVALDPI